jgi:hypothetical protein
MRDLQSLAPGVYLRRPGRPLRLIPGRPYRVSLALVVEDAAGDAALHVETALGDEALNIEVRP